MDKEITSKTIGAATRGRKRKALDDEGVSTEPKRRAKPKAETSHAESKPRKTRVKKDTEEVEKKPRKTKKPLQENDEVDTEGSYNGNSPMWNEAEMLSLHEKVPHKLAENFIALLEEGCTLPFIARYRKAAVDHLMPDK